MIVRYWNPTRETLSQQIDRLFDNFVDTQEPKALTTWTPAVEVVEKADAIVVRAYLPGIAASDVDVQVTKNSVMIAGVRKRPELAEGERTLYSDATYGQFRRFIELPTKVQNTNTEASFEQGVLYLTLPKAEEEKNKVVKISLDNPALPEETTGSAAETGAN